MELLPHKQIGKKYGYIYLLISLMLMLVLFPFLNQSLFSQILFNLFFSLTLIASLYTISTTLKRFLLGILFLVPSLITRWVPYFSSFQVDIIINHVVTFLFLCYIIYVICYSIFSEKNIRLNTVYGATCVYILLGVLWATVFGFIDYLDPHAFSDLDLAYGSGYLDPLTYRFENILYFSFVTLTTLGYGDIVPLSPGVKFLSIIEAITGQLYIATSIARTLGLYISHRYKGR